MSGPGVAHLLTDPGGFAGEVIAFGHTRGDLGRIGIEVGEVLGLRHEDIDPAGRLIRVRARRNSNQPRVKSGHARSRYRQP